MAFMADPFYVLGGIILIIAVLVIFDELTILSAFSTFPD